jgi:hypothetical protein
VGRDFKSSREEKNEKNQRSHPPIEGIRKEVKDKKCISVRESERQRAVSARRGTAGE